jgi:hypothetical protein
MRSAFFIDETGIDASVGSQRRMSIVCLVRRKLDEGKWIKLRLACQSREIRTSGTQRMFLAND